MGALPKMRGVAQERIAYGAHVLCRNFEVRRAEPAVANGTACPRRKGQQRFSGRPEPDFYKRGDVLDVNPIEGLGDRDLHAIAAGPIMEPLNLYLPAGKITEAEYQERLKLDFERIGEPLFTETGGSHPIATASPAAVSSACSPAGPCAPFHSTEVSDV